MDTLLWVDQRSVGEFMWDVKRRTKESGSGIRDQGSAGRRSAVGGRELEKPFDSN